MSRGFTLTYSDKEILRALERLSPDHSASHFLTAKQIAFAAKTPVVTVRKSIKRLHAEKKIDAKVKPGHNGGISYRILNGSDTD